MAPNDHSLEEQQTEVRQLALPTLVFGLVEIHRLRRELEALEEYMRTAELRQPGTQAALPRMSRLLDALATDNRCNLLQSADRKTLADFLLKVEQTAPTVHMSFASDPSASFTAKVVTWLRASVHPMALLQVGLQPTLAAGCVVRTNNKQFDFSLREAFTKNKALLLQSFDHEAGTTPVAAAAPVQAANAPAMTATEQMAHQALRAVQSGGK